MDALQQLWHLLNLLMPPLAWAALHAAFCILIWRRDARTSATTRVIA